MNRIITFLFLALFSSFTSAQTFLGPTMSCSFTNKNYLPSEIKISVYSSDIFGLSSDIQLLYSYPEFGETLTLISLLSLENNEDHYIGKISNLDYLVSAKLDVGNRVLKLNDRGTEHIFKGKCQ